MIDRERLLKAIEFCRANARCDGCPYDGECGTRDNAIEDDTLAILYAQNPIAPNKPGTAYKTTWSCGVCAYPISTDWVACPSCGRSVKWNDED